jgi:hypothetical protein
MPFFQMNYTAIIIAVIAHFILGFIWYTPLFGKVWGREMGYDMNVKPKSSELVRGMVFMILGNLLMAVVLFYTMALWRPMTWGQDPLLMISPLREGLMTAIIVWLGFFLPVDIGRVAWERKSWKLFFIDTGYHLASLLLVALIFAYSRPSI